ncbi:terminase small subunit [Bacillus sp. NPDC077411]|uniref:terminase small subunit n=1 Tax=Bacillus sp. NPDC077411 TaxID=3363947 RepID=UPI0037C96DAB
MNDITHYDDEKSYSALSPSDIDRAIQNFHDVPFEIVSKVNLKQQKFVHSLVKNNMNIRAASKEAGITEQYGHKLKNDPNIRAYYTAIMQRESFSNVVSLHESLALASEIARGMKTDGTPITEDVLNMKSGQVSQLRVSNKDRLKALEFMLKTHKILFNGKDENNPVGNTTIIVDISDSDKELVENSLARKDITPSNDDYIDI